MSETRSLEHEELVTKRGCRSGIPITIAVHSRVLGPAIGGCRMRHYPDWRDGVVDALRLSKAMTYKSAVAGVRFGGGKSVIAVPEGTEVSAALRRAVLEDLGELIASFNGTYIAGPDVGTGPDDMFVLKQATPHVFCIPEIHGGTGSSSRPTAVGVLAALRAGMRDVFDAESMSGRVAVIIGLGAVGTYLARSLSDAGARVIASDVDETRQRFAAECGLDWVHPDQALGMPADVIIPAAVGDILSPDSAAHLSAPLIVGPANNQLTDDSVAELLARQGVVWIPDFVASAGGVIHTLAREINGLDDHAAMEKVGAIDDTVSRLLHTARENGTTPLHEAMDFADRRLATAG